MLDDEIIGSKIKQYRIEKGLTQKELGKAITKSESSIQKYERGDVEIPNSVLAKIAETLEVNVLELLGVRDLIDDSKRVINDIKETLQFKKESPILFSLLALYDLLNDDGKLKAVERLEELSMIEKYSKSEEERNKDLDEYNSSYQTLKNIILDLQEDD